MHESKGESACISYTCTGMWGVEEFTEIKAIRIKRNLTNEAGKGELVLFA